MKNLMILLITLCSCATYKVNIEYNDIQYTPKYKSTLVGIHPVTGVKTYRLDVPWEVNNFDVQIIKDIKGVIDAKRDKRIPYIIFYDICFICDDNLIIKTMDKYIIHKAKQNIKEWLIVVQK